ncbi:T9SS type A sorting domain-containing protein [Chryseobacterium gotjawalense]|uniref:T9SS type A sorting domain-containing protein n=1 Tax=Chryseobacterium gotjawalense TaxID=3042315 RepID=A0ABY8RIJ4_9FLAO|nr:T9SS type A sorting domain-containing protein [Chryseobacterium sp. wdc7]WHF53077.1 T9SS type A sorting domain-containing protein [Chryseobacterium sp. wdc7]
MMTTTNIFFISFNKNFLFTFLFLLASIFSHAQNVGDFQTRPSGITWPQNWTSSVWQIYQSDGQWHDTTAYPDNTARTVTILAGAEINTDIASVIIGNLYVKGKLNVTRDFTIKTFGTETDPILFIENGTVTLTVGNTLYLPAESNIFINIDQATKGIQTTGGCNGNTRVKIGLATFSACQGNGQGDGTFSTINQAAADGTAFTIAGPTLFCAGTSSVGLTGRKLGLQVASNIKWELTAKPTGVGTFVVTSSDSTFPFSTTVPATLFTAAGDYVFTFSFEVQVDKKTTKTFQDFVTVSVNGPTFTSRPAPSTTYCQNDVATALSVVASGTGTLTYQWYSNSANNNTGGAPINGATGSSYTPPTNTAGTVYYYVVVAAGCGVVASNTAQVTVNASTAIINTHPLAASYCQNNAAIAMSVAGKGFTGYQWYSNTTNSNTGGTAISGATSSSYTPSTATAGIMYYYVTVRGSCGSVTSNTALITVTANNTVELTSAAGTNSQAKCISTAITPIAYATTGATGATVTGLPAGVTGSWSANVVTISGTPTVSGSFSYTVTLTGGCGAITSTGTITVTVNNTVTLTSVAGTNSQTKCLSTAITPITYATTGATGATVTGLPAGVTGSWAANVVTISGTPTVSGPFSYTVTLTGGCVAITATGTITVTAANTSGVPSSSPTVCINTAIPNVTIMTTGATGIGSATGLPIGVSANWSGNVITISGTPTASGTFSYSIPLTGGCGSVTATGTITVTATNTAGVASSTPTLCINTALINITHSTTGATGISNSGVSGANGLPAGVSATWSANVISISGTPTASGTFNYSITLTGGCGLVSATGTITVFAGNTVGAVSSYPSLCLGNSLTITHATTGSTGLGTVTGLPIGVNASWSGNVLTISGTPTSSGTFNYSIALTGGCGTANATGTITVNALPTASVTGNNQICKNTDAVFNLTGTPGATVMYNINGGGNSSVVLAGGTALVTVPLATVNQTLNIVSVSNGTCINSTGSSATVKVGEDSVYTGTVPTGSWSRGLPNDDGLNAVIAGNYNTSEGDIKACNCTVQSGGVLAISAGTFAEFENNITNNGTLTVESDGNLIQVNKNAVNSGNIVVKRDIKFSAGRQQYNYLISPVKNMGLKDIYKDEKGNPVAVPFVLYHNEADNKFYNSSGAYIPGRALAVKEATGVFAPSTMTAIFTGEPMNGDLLYNLVNSSTTNTNRGYNLIGNPYPSNLDLAAFYRDNSDGLSPTFNLWDSTANTRTTQEGDNYGGQAYSQWNAATPPGSGSGVNAKGDVATAKIPTKYVKVGQGFMAKSLVSTKKVTFTNTMRSTGAAEGFFGKEAVSFDRYWLNLTSPANITSQIAVVYFPGGNDAYTLEDSNSLLGTDAIYSLVENQPVSINGKSSFRNTDVVLLGTNHFANGNYTIALGNQKDGVFANGQNIYLKDKQTGVITNLSEGNYTFASNAGESTGRFEIIYQPGAVLATDAATKEELVIYRDNSDFVVKAQTKQITAIEVYDAAGRLIYRVQPNSKTAVIAADRLVNGVYILKISQNGQLTSRKIVR